MPSRRSWNCRKKSTVHGSLKAHATITSQGRKNRKSPLQKLYAISLPHQVQNPKPFLPLETKQSSSKITLSSSLCVSRFYSRKPETQFSKRKTLTLPLFIRPAGKQKKVSLSSSLKFSVFFLCGGGCWPTRTKQEKRRNKKGNKKEQRQKGELYVIG
jgi:hypothetical protein